jgi:hypothetical protein
MIPGFLYPSGGKMIMYTIMAVKFVLPQIFIINPRKDAQTKREVIIRESMEKLVT